MQHYQMVLTTEQVAFLTLLPPCMDQIEVLESSRQKIRGYGIR